MASSRDDGVDFVAAGLVDPREILTAFLNLGKPRPASGPMPASEPAEGQSLLDLYIQQAAGTMLYSRTTRVEDYPAGQQILKQSAADMALTVHELLERLPGNRNAALPTLLEDHSVKVVSRSLLGQLLRHKLPLAVPDLVDLLSLLSNAGSLDSWYYLPAKPILNAVETHVEEHGLDDNLKQALEKVERLVAGKATTQDHKKTLERIQALRGQVATGVNLDAGEPWAQAVLQDLTEMESGERLGWLGIIKKAHSADGSKPSKKWLKEAEGTMEALGVDKVKKRLLHWFPLVAQPRPQPFRHQDLPPDSTVWLLVEPNAQVLKGLAWMSGTLDDPAISRALGDLAELCLKKIPWHGPRCKKVGNACLYVLGILPGSEAVAQLSRLKAKVKHASSRRLTDKALGTVATRTGLSQEDLEETSVPTYGLGADGKLRRAFSRCTAEVAITGTRAVEVAWLREDGTPQKSVPAAVKQEHAADLKDLQRSIKDMEKMLPAQRDRIERLLRSDRDWDCKTWRERYVDHPLLANLSRRLIWSFRHGDRKATGTWLSGSLVDADDKPVDWFDEQTRVQLWHPSAASAEVVLAWRRWLERHEITQPFKQAHREVYLLTDAERETRFYSNRFAGHIIRQHQLAALCQQRGWVYRLHSSNWDGANMPTLDLPERGLRIEFWVHAAEASEGDPQSTMGVSLYLTTDQVRFLRDDYMHVTLAEIPPLVFSEVMRDIDLFVGVASIGNDPNWQDRFSEAYWHRFAFGDLSESAHTRRDVLERLVPRLKISQRCSFADKFLVVRGDLRTYKIHLGSGNILMEPNNQYLCIVPSRGAAARGKDRHLFLPFEGDSTLAEILSKAFLLAEDNKITDPSICHQIGQR